MNQDLIARLFLAYLPQELISDVLKHHSEREAFEVLNQLLVEGMW